MGALFSAGNTVKRRQDNPMGWEQQPARLWTSSIGMLLTISLTLICQISAAVLADKRKQLLYASQGCQKSSQGPSSKAADL